MTEAASQNRLTHLAGEWTGDETIAPSQWGEGGKAVARISARMELNQKLLVQDYSAERGGAPWLKAHAVFTFDEQAGAYSLFWFDSLGFVPAQAAPGQWDRQSLRFIRTSPRGQARHTYTFTVPDAYQLKLESSFDGGATWVLVMEGAYSRIG